jgi:class 3 adenylate cyclase
MSTRNLIMDERILMALFPATQAGWRAAFVVEHLSAHMCVGLFFIFFRLIFPEEMPKWAVGTALAVCGLWAGLEILTPPLFCHRFLPWFEYFILAASLFVFVVIVRAMAKRREGAPIILGGLVLLVLCALNDVLLSNGFIEGMYAASFGMFLFTLSQGIFLAQRSARLFREVESYVAELEEVNTSLERFIPKEMLDFLGKESIVDVGLGDYIEARMSVLFLDIRGFTSRSEGMSPDANFRFINSFLEEFGPLVRKRGGFIDKYLGDGFMALFPGEADDALDSALDMRGGLAAFNERLAGMGQESLRFGIGIHTGALMLGTIGENLRMDTTVISDTVNTASRLEELNKEFGTDILISEETRLALAKPARYSVKPLAESHVKGKSKVIKVYLLEGKGL